MLLPLIININNQQQIKTSPTIKVIKQLTPEEIFEQYYQYTINNSVDKTYHVFNKILVKEIIIAKNNPILLKKYQQLKNNWDRQQAFTVKFNRWRVGSSYTSYYLLFFIILTFVVLYLIIVLIGDNNLKFKIDKNFYDIAKYIQLNNNINKNFNNIILYNNCQFYFAKYFYYLKVKLNTSLLYRDALEEKKYSINEILVESAIKNIKNAYKYNEKGINFNDFDYNMLKKIYYFDFWELCLQKIYEKNNLKYFTGNDFFLSFIIANDSDNEGLLEQLEQEIYNHFFSEKNDYEQILKQIIANVFNAIFYIIKNINIDNNNVTISFIEDKFTIFNELENRIHEKEGNNFTYVKGFCKNIKKKGEKNFDYKISKSDTDFTDFVKRDCFNILNTCEEKIGGRKYWKIERKDSSWKEFKSKQEVLKAILLIFRLIFILFFITRYLFGYQYLINTIKKIFKKGVIKINGFTYVKEKDCFNVDDGFEINNNGVNYYRLSSLLTSRNYWQLIMQLIIDLLILGFYGFSYYVSGTSLFYYSNFLIISIVMVVFLLFSIVYYCIPTWQQYFFKIS